MKAEGNRLRELEDLRRRAEALLERAPGGDAPEAVKDLGELAYELQISYTELEIQNQELRETQVRLAASQAEFFDLYNQAPVGSLTLDEQGVIHRLNATAREWFGRDSDRSRNHHFFPFVAPAYRGRFLMFLRQVFAAEDRLETTFEIHPPQGQPRWVAASGYHLRQSRDGTRGTTCLLTLTDISALKRTQQELRQKESQYRAIIEAVQDGLLIYDEEGVLAALNPAASQLLDHPMNKLVGRPVTEVFAREAETLLARVRTGIRDHGSFTTRTEVRRQDGSSLPVDLTCVKFLYQSSPHTLVLFRDIRDRLAAERKLRQAAIVFEHSNEGILVLDADYRITLLNEAALAITGHPREGLLGRDVFELQSGRKDDLRKTVINALGGEEPWAGEISLRRPTGEPYTVWMTLTAYGGDAGRERQIIVVFHDVTEHRKAAEKIRRLAHYDALTGLPNRALFQDRIHQAITRARRARTCLAVLFIDLDNFKTINDTLGHLAGDQLLQESAQRLQNCLRAEDTVVRMGGDEFTALIGGLPDAATARRVGARLSRAILQALAKPIPREGHEIITGASIGLALYPGDTEDPEELVQHADAAMYAAKKSGRGCFRFFSEEVNEQAHRRLQLETGLRQALHQGEMQMHYQPEVGARDGDPVGMEALLRWTRSDGSTVPTAEFIGVAEESGLIIRLGEWILEQVCRQGRRWLDQGCRFGRVAVNISPRQLLQADFVDRVRRVLADTGLPPEYLEMEVVERAFAADNAQGVAGLADLRRQGITVAIDDFGRGYSSLGGLRELPVDKLKVDRSFIAGLEGTPPTRDLVGAIVQLGRTLGLTVLAEGVERETQATLVRQAGCDQMQGYWFGHPLPPDQAAELLN